MAKSRNLSEFSEYPVKKLEKFSNTTRLVIYLGIILIIVVPIIYFNFLPKSNSVTKAKKRYSQLIKKLSIVKTKASLPGQKQKELKQLFDLASEVTPNKNHLPSLLKSISFAGKHAGLEFLLFEPQTEIVNKFYNEIPVFMSLRGNYHNIGIFFNNLYNQPGIVTIKEIKMIHQHTGNKLITSCTVAIYRFFENPEP